MLGLMWLPCVGPTLGATIALASLGQDRGLAFVVMFAFGIGTSAMLIVITSIASKTVFIWPITLAA